jgi:LEA14-like dessication related protein
MVKTIIYLLAFSLLSACTTLNPDYEEPTVIMTAFRAVPTEGAMPSFEVGLRIINPNPTPLDLQGVVYSISLQGHELVKGVGKDYPQIEGYSEGNITLSASANLLRGIQFLAGMVKSPDKQLEYEFEAKLDVGGFFPSLKVSETGMFDLGNQ